MYGEWARIGGGYIATRKRDGKTYVFCSCGRWYKGIENHLAFKPKHTQFFPAPFDIKPPKLS